MAVHHRRTAAKGHRLLARLDGVIEHGEVFCWRCVHIFHTPFFSFPDRDLPGPRESTVGSGYDADVSHIFFISSLTLRNKLCPDVAVQEGAVVVRWIVLSHYSHEGHA